MKKIVNLRPMLLLFFGVLCGIFVANAFFTNQHTALAWAIIALFSVFGVFTVLSFLIKYKVFLKFLKIRTLFAIFLLVFMLGAGSFLVAVERFEGVKLEGQTYLIEGTLTDVMQPTEYGMQVHLKNSLVIAQNETFTLSKQVRLTIFGAEELEEGILQAGNKLIFEANIFDFALIKDGAINTFVYINNLGYYGGVTAQNLVILQQSMPLDTAIRSHVKEMLHNYLTYDNANIAYAALFGDKTLLNDNIYSSFVRSGIAHMLAVSGLHIGFLVLMLLFIFNSLRLNKRLSFALLALILFGYAYLCAFSPSVVRASIMALTILAAHLLGEQNDNLSSLCFAGIIILLFNPVSLFTAGFLLSFASVFAIIVLYPAFNKFFKKLRFPNWLSGAISLTLAAQIGTLPLVAQFFGEINLLGVLTNVLALPMFTLGYLFLFDSVVLSAILPFFAFLFIVPNLMFTFVYLLAKLVSSLLFFIVSLFGFGMFAGLVYYCLIFVVSRFVMVSTKIKVLVCGLLVGAMLTGIVFANLPSVFNENSVFAISDVNSAVIITTQQNEVYLLDVGDGGRWDEYYLQRFLQKNRIKHLHGLIITNYIEAKQQTVVSLLQDYKIKDLYIQHTDNNILLFGLLMALPDFTSITLLEHDTAHSIGSLQLTAYISAQKGLAMRASVGSIDMLFLNNRLTSSEFSTAIALIDEGTNVLVLNNMTQSRYDALLLNPHFEQIDYIFAYTSILLESAQNLHNINEVGSLHLKQSYDTLVLVN